MTFLTTSTQNCIRGSRQDNLVRKRNQSLPDWKGRKELSLIANDMILDLENPNETTHIKTLLKLKEK